MAEPDRRPRYADPLETVVVGVDGSATAAAGLSWAARRVNTSGSLHVVHALDRSGDRDAIRLALEGEWTAAARELGARVHCRVDDGDPAEVLLAQAVRCGAGALVVGAHGAGGAGRRSPFLGGVTRKLLNDELPLVVHHGSDGESDGPVVASIGYGGPAEATAHWAAAYASSTERRLVLLHAVSHRPIFPLDSPVDMLGSYLGPGVDLDWAETDLIALREELLDRFADLDITTNVAQGSAVRAVLDAGSGSGAGHGAEIVVVGRPSAAHRPTSPRLYKIIARAQCPTAVVPSRKTT